MMRLGGWCVPRSPWAPLSALNFAVYAVYSSAQSIALRHTSHAKNKKRLSSRSL